MHQCMYYVATIVQYSVYELKFMSVAIPLQFLPDLGTFVINIASTRTDFATSIPDTFLVHILRKL